MDVEDPSNPDVRHRADGAGPRDDDSHGDGADTERFIAELTQAQASLRAYIFAAVGNHNDTSDILQRANLVLWKNAGGFRPGAPFMPWAITITKYEVLSHYRDRSRDRHVFAEDVAMLMFQTAQERMSDPNDRQVALRECVEQLPKTSREMVRLRYESGDSIRQIAEALDRSDNAIKCAFLRIRKSLEQCVERQLQAESR